MRLHAILTVRNRLPIEVVDMILDYLPLELALALEHLSGISRESSLRRLRCDPITRRLERASQVFKHEGLIQHKTSKIKLEPRMRAQFVEFRGKWYL
jgi:hypothetical protein